MKNVAFFLLMLFPLISYSQKEAAIWYFGEYAGLDFNSGVPVVLTDGQINTFEGCATISDYQGNLLFYTNGITVWDRNHNIMPNGTGLLGDVSSTQSAIIIPKPNNNNQYYIFTVDKRNNTNPLSTNGIRYSTVDLTLNGGFGDVIATEKNVLLVNRAYEKITAVKHSDNNSYWVITFIEDRFLSWRVTAAGVNTTAVISNVTYASDSRGYLKISPDGTKIACANFGNPHSLMLYDFNDTTGTVSNEQQLNLDTANDVPYGVEFSPASNNLYAATCQLNVNDHIPPSKVIQFDMLSADIPNSGVVIHSSNINTRGGLQLAIDGKIYRALSTGTQIGTDFLGVINNPDALGLACTYVHDAIDISNGDAFRNVVEGLPPFVSSFFDLPQITANDVCFGTSTQFNLNYLTPPTSVTWDFGDPSSGTNNVSTIENPTHLFSSSGVFTVTATVITGTVTNVLTMDVTIYDIPVITTPVTIVQCDDDIDGIVDFNLETANTLISTQTPTPTITYFLTQAEALAGTPTITNPTVFSNAVANSVWARVENASNCIATAEVILQVASTDIPDDLMITFNECDTDIDGNDANGITTFDFSSATSQVLNALLPETNLTVNYYENIPDALAQINSINPTNYTNTLSPNTQQIVVRVDDINSNCFGLGYHVTLNVNPLPEFDLVSAATLCLSSENSKIGIQNPLDVYSYEWRNEAGDIIGNTQEINITTEGLYTVTATDSNGNNCTKTKTTQVTESPIGELLNFNHNNIVIVDNSTNNNITILTDNLPTSNYEFALDNGTYQTNNYFEGLGAGKHTVFIRDIENCLVASVEISLIAVPNFFTPNNDGFNDTWHIVGIDAQPTSNVYIFDRFGKLIIVLDPLGPGWNGNYKGNPLPSTDYWYKAELEDGRTLRGNFSLIRR